MANPAFRPQCTEIPLADGFLNNFIEVTLFRVASAEFAGMLPGGRKGTCGTIRFRLAGWNHVSAGSQDRAYSLDIIRQPSRHRQLYQRRAACQVSVKATIFFILYKRRKDFECPLRNLPLCTLHKPHLEF